MVTLFKNGFVYSTESHTFIRKDILVENGIIIDDNYTKNTDYAGLTIVDCEGKFVLPGLVDVHTHGRAGFDFNTASETDYDTIRASYAKSGTTTFMATLASASYDSLVKSIDAINNNRTVNEGMATIGGIHLEGRYLSLKRRGAHAEELLSPLDVKELEDFLNKMQPLPTHISAAVEQEGGEEFVRTAVALGATCGLAHSDATYDEAVKAVEWGVKSFTHTFNAMKPIHHREPGNITASLMTNSAYTEVICDGEHVHPVMIDMTRRLKPADRLVLITDSMEATGCPDGEYSIAGLPVFVKNGRAVNAEGALAGSTLDLWKALRNFMKFTGATLEEAIPCATSNPASMVKLDKICGSIKSGLRADLLMIDDKNSDVIESVWIAGKKI